MRRLPHFAVACACFVKTPASLLPQLLLSCYRASGWRRSGALYPNNQQKNTAPWIFLFFFCVWVFRHLHRIGGASGKGAVFAVLAVISAHAAALSPFSLSLVRRALDPCHARLPSGSLPSFLLLSCFRGLIRLYLYFFPLLALAKASSSSSLLRVRGYAPLPLSLPAHTALR